MNRLKRLGIDAYMLLLLATVLAGIILPAQGAAAHVLGHVTYWAVSLLFFLYGAKLDPRGVRDGFLNWRLQGLTFGATFVMFPIFGLIMATVASPVLGQTLALGILFLAVLPSTVQSSIAFTSIARGNVAGAICAASVSNLVGVFLTPALVALLLHADGGGVRIEAIVKIGVQILLPFTLGQILRPMVGRLVQRRKAITQAVDRGSILLIVYAAFSASTVAGLWADIPLGKLIVLFVAVAVFLAAAMGAMVLIGQISKMPYADRKALFYCGATKSLASGLPIATALFASEQVGAIVLPLMMYHMLQLLVSAYLSQKDL